MPKEGEPSRKSKMELKKIIKVNIVKATPKPRNTRETAKLVWSCEQHGCCKTYNSHSSLRRHVRETHEKSAYQCGCGVPFKRLEYLMTHQLRCNKRSVATQTPSNLENSRIVFVPVPTSFSPMDTASCVFTKEELEELARRF
jgi:hypothetical protein